MYDIRGDRPAKARELGNLTPGDGAKYAGRGYVQLTGKSNYVKATAKLREMGFTVDLVAEPDRARSEEHTSELQSLMRISYAVFCLKKKKKQHLDKTLTHTHTTTN